MSESQHQLDTHATTKQPHVQSAHASAKQVETVATVQRDLLPPAPVLPCDSSLQAHAAALHRVAALQPSHSANSLYRLQRWYGNRYVQRMVALARKSDGGADVAPEVEDAIQRARGGGQPLDTGARTHMESALGVDFSRVRVHTGTEADTLNRAVSARAFTTGQDIFFRDGEYNPQNSSGRELIAHELTHVVQQTGGVQRKLVVSEPGDLYEQEADRVARAVVTLEQHELSDGRARQSIQRQSEEEQEDHDLILQSKGAASPSFEADVKQGSITHVVQRQQERETAYIVQAGDSLARIATKFGVTVQSLEARNASKLKTWSTRRGNIHGFEAGALIFISAPRLTATHATEPSVQGPGGRTESTRDLASEPTSKAPALSEPPTPGSPKDPHEVIEYHNQLGTFGKGVRVKVTSTKRDAGHQLEILRDYCKSNRAKLDKFAEATDWLKGELDWDAFEKCSLSDQKVWLPFFFALFYGGGGPGTKSHSRTLPLVGSPIQAMWKGRPANASPHLAGKAMDVKGMDLATLSTILTTQIHEFQIHGAFPIRSTQIENVKGQQVVHINFEKVVF